MKTALVTGAGRGIGLAAAHLFLRAGLRVLGLDKDFSKCDLPADARVQFDLQNLAEIQLLADAAATAVDASDDPSGDASTHQ